MLEQPTEPLGVVIVIINSNNQRVLLGKRKNSYMSGYYGMPGGRIELNEPLINAALRELQEETGIIADETNLTYLGVIRELQDSYNFIHFAFILENPQREINNSEPEKCEGWEWVKLNELPENILEGHKAAIKMYGEKISVIDIV